MQNYIESLSRPKRGAGTRESSIAFCAVRLCREQAICKAHHYVALSLSACMQPPTILNDDQSSAIPVHLCCPGTLLAAYEDVPATLDHRSRRGFGVEEEMADFKSCRGNSRRATRLAGRGRPAGARANPKRQYASGWTSRVPALHVS